MEIGIKCVKCWYIHERDHPYRPDVYGSLSKEDINNFNGIINSLEHDKGCEKK